MKKKLGKEYTPAKVWLKTHNTNDDDAITFRGGYVLYRLFKKPEESAPSCNCDEMERRGLSLTPTLTESSPSVTQHETDTFEEFGTPMAPSSDVSPVSDIQEDPQSLLKAAESQPQQIPRWSADKPDHFSMKPEDVCNRHAAIEQEAEAGIVVDRLLDVLGQSIDSKDEQLYSNGFPSINSPMRPYSNHPFFGSTVRESYMGFYQPDYSEHDPMNELLNSILNNSDDYPNSAMVPLSEVIHSRSSSEVDTEVGFTQGGTEHYDHGWFNMDDASGDYLEINALFENTSLLPCDSAALDVCSLDSGAESLQELLNSIEESNNYNNSVSNRDGVEETGSNGIKIRSRQPQQPALDNLSAQQGFARRRIRLQMLVGEVSGTERESSRKKEEDEGSEATIEVEVNKKHEKIANVETISDSTSFMKREAIPIHDDSDVFSNVEESKPKLRLRTKTSKEAVTASDKLKGPDRRIKTSRPAVAISYVIFFAVIIMILVLLCARIWRVKRSQSLWISEHDR